jgi:acetate kinase
MNFLIPNIGSTSFKFRLIRMPERKSVFEGRVERIGQAGAECSNYHAAIQQCIQQIAGPGKALSCLDEVDAVGFKVVHAGPLNVPQLIDDALIEAMEEFAFLVPAHNPPYLAAIRAFRQDLPAVPLIAVPETAPYGEMDEAATTYAVPYHWREEFGVRRYGFHGASHRAASERVCELMGSRDLRHISCHLGGSSSVACFSNGVAVDTSFGMSGQSGLPQNNRVGDIDVFAALYVMKKQHLNPDQMAELLSVHSGLAGVSGTSGDVRDLVLEAAAGGHRAQLALDVFVRAIRHYLGAFMFSLGGVDAITFSGGIGENSEGIRAAVLKDTEAFGVELDADKNHLVHGEGAISTDDSKVRVLVIPANEEMIIAREMMAVMERNAVVEEGLA